MDNKVLLYEIKFSIPPPVGLHMRCTFRVYQFLNEENNENILEESINLAFEKAKIEMKRIIMEKLNKKERQDGRKNRI